MVTGIAHTALYTDKFEETIDFYKKAFDAEDLGRFETAHKGVWLKIGDSILEIFEETPLPEGMFKHIAFSCDDVDATYAKALACGATPHVEPKDTVLAMNEPQYLRIAFVKGVSGEQIEFCAPRKVDN